MLMVAILHLLVVLEEQLAPESVIMVLAGKLTIQCLAAAAVAAAELVILLMVSAQVVLVVVVVLVAMAVLQYGQLIVENIIVQALLEEKVDLVRLVVQMVAKVI